jgi:hypothetical protein
MCRKAALFRVTVSGLRGREIQGKINILNIIHFFRSTNFKLLNQIKLYSMNVIFFKFIIYVTGGHCDFSPPATLLTVIMTPPPTPCFVLWKPQVQILAWGRVNLTRAFRGLCQYLLATTEITHTITP